MISFQIENSTFNYRVAAVIIHDGKLLLHHSEVDSFWTLPGGRCEMMEFSKDTLKREFLEEINEEIHVNQLLWVVENLFKYNAANVHELCFFFSANLQDDSKIINQDEFIGIETNMKLIFKWFKFEDLKTVKVYPEFLPEKINSISDSIEHFFVDQIGNK